MNHHLPIIGTGLTAKLAALALSRAGFSPLLLAQRRPSASAPVSPPVLALSSFSVRQLQQWGVGISFAFPFRRLETYSTSLKPDFYVCAEEAGLDSLGAIVPMEKLHATIEKTLAPQASSYPLLNRWQANRHGVEVKLASGEIINAPLAILAVPPESAPRPYHAASLSGIINHARQKEAVARQFFTPLGPLALLPLSPSCSGFVWSVAQQQADALANLAHEKPDYFASLLAAHAPVLQQVQSQGRVAVFPLAFALSAPIGRRCIYLGAGLRQLHPLAGQGFNLAIKDIHALAELLRRAQGLGLEAGGGEMLAAYAKARRGESLLFAALTDMLALGMTGGMLQAALQGGMKLAGGMGFVRRLAARAASGEGIGAAGL